MYKSASNWSPVSDWCDTKKEASKHLNGIIYQKVLLEKGIHFGKWQYRYCVKA